MSTLDSWRLEAHVAIHDLYGRWSHALDRGASALALDDFTPDGVLWAIDRGSYHGHVSWPRSSPRGPGRRCTSSTVVVEPVGETGPRATHTSNWSTSAAAGSSPGASTTTSSPTTAAAGVGRSRRSSSVGERRNTRAPSRPWPLKMPDHQTRSEVSARTPLRASARTPMIAAHRHLLGLGFRESAFAAGNRGGYGATSGPRAFLTDGCAAVPACGSVVGRFRCADPASCLWREVSNLRGSATCDSLAARVSSKCRSSRSRPRPRDVRFTCRDAPSAASNCGLSAGTARARSPTPGGVRTVVVSACGHDLGRHHKGP